MPRTRPASQATRQRATRRANIAVFTGTRAEYGLLLPVMRAIDRHPQLNLQLVVTGMHLLRPCGYTIKDIRRDGWRIDATIPMQRGVDQPTEQADAIARGIRGMARWLAEYTPDMLVLLGDRIEPFAAAVAATTLNIPIAHIHGGDIAPGHIDNQLRDSISRMASLHLAATKKAAIRLHNMGIPQRAIVVTGAPGLDDLLQLRRLHDDRATSDDTTPYALIVQHAYGRTARTEQAVMSHLLRAVQSAGLHRAIILPNTDRGNQGIHAAIAAHVGRSKPDDISVHASLPREQYLRLLMNAEVLIGNSSSGMIEAAPAGTPSINIGSRQQGRDCNGAVIHADETYAAICNALHAALHGSPRQQSTRVSKRFGDGNAGERIALAIAGAIAARGSLAARHS